MEPYRIYIVRSHFWLTSMVSDSFTGYVGQSLSDCTCQKALEVLAEPAEARALVGDFSGRRSMALSMNLPSPATITAGGIHRVRPGLWFQFRAGGTKPESSRPIWKRALVDDICHVSTRGTVLR